MPFTNAPEWQQLALYAAGAAVLLLILFNIPVVGRLFRGLFSLAVLAFGLFLLFQMAPFDPTLSRLTAEVGLDRQVVRGGEVRVPLARDGHYWVTARLNGVERRMLVDSGATITAISPETAEAVGVTRDGPMAPILLRTANGTVRAEGGTVATVALGDIEASDLKVVIAPGLGPVDVLGMNFLSRLEGWRVEKGVLVLAGGGES